VIFTGKVVLSSDSGVGHPALVGAAITLQYVSLIASTTNVPVFGLAPLFVGLKDLTILYGNTTSNISEPISQLPEVVLQIGNLVLPPGHDWNLSILSEHGTKTIELATPAVKSLLTTVPGFGSYHLNASSIGLSGQLVTDSGNSIFLATSSRVFFPIAQFQQQSLPTAPPRSVPVETKSRSSPVPLGSTVFSRVSSTSVPTKSPSSPVPLSSSVFSRESGVPVRTKTASPGGLVRPTVTPHSTGSSSTDNHPDAGESTAALPTAAVVGISIGAVAVVVVVVGVICCIRRRKRNKTALFSQEVNVPYTY
jgi:hypothetical protein